MSIFGALDADKIPDNPYWVREGEYDAIIGSAFMQKNEKRNVDQLVIVYTITTPGEFLNSEARDWFDVYPDVTEEDLEAMPASDAKKVMQALSAVKRRLCGKPEEGNPGLGVDFEDLKKDDWSPDVLVNREVDLAVVNKGDRGQFSNVAWAVIKQ